MGNVAERFLGPWFMILSFVYYVLCFIGMLTGLEAWLGWPGWVAFIVGVFVISGFPLISAFLGIMGAVKGWGWDWYWAVLVFMPGIVLFALSMGSGLIAMIASHVSNRHSSASSGPAHKDVRDALPPEPKKDISKMTVTQLKQEASNGNTDAFHRLGLIYQIGSGVSQDKQEATKWYKLFAKHSPNPAVLRLLLAPEKMGLTRGKESDLSSSQKQEIRMALTENRAIASQHGSKQL